MFNDNYDDELEPDYSAPTNRIQTLADLDNRDLQVGDKLICLDDSWLHIFTEYRTVGSCITTLYVAEVLPDFNYRIGIIEIVLMAGSLQVPAGITAIVTLDHIREAVKQTEALRQSIAPKPKVISAPKPKGPKPIPYDYDGLTKLLNESNGQVVVPVPANKSLVVFRSLIHSAFKSRKIPVTVNKVSPTEVRITKLPGSISQTTDISMP